MGHAVVVPSTFDKHFGDFPYQMTLKTYRKNIPRHHSQWVIPILQVRLL